ncbi:MAG TPA: response regulator [Aliidongia sp.]|nr:response regulator [Aliidongia sp.]
MMQRAVLAAVLPPASPADSSGASPAVSELVSAMRVLVIEDDAMIGVLLADMLEQLGFEVCAIESNEADAVAAAHRYRPGLMIVDARLGTGSGISAVDEILRTRTVPHLFVSGDTSMVRKLRPDAVVLQKPFREHDLTRAIERVLGTATIY